MVWLSDTQKIGVGLTGFGVFFTFMGIMLFFDSGLIAIGNVLFLSGVVLIIGPQKTGSFFFSKPQKLRGTICFFGGIVLVFMKWPVFGILLEAFGFVNLFGDFFPVALSFLRRLPIIGTFLCLPGVAHVLDRIAGVSSSPV
ncbi:Got1-domain-containing protein [Ramicandelaber brevisporus]|nr:Got1-domain-containing protein [Ramicandelaber brevisporus]